MSFRFELIKSIRDKLLNKIVTIGTWQQIPHASISEILGQSGYDWVAVDMEHGSVSVDQLPDLFRAVELGGTLPLARIAESKPKDCKQALDAGAGGIIAPMIESSDQLRIVRNACCWPPVGTRGVGFSRANLSGKNFDMYKEEAQLPLLIAQIEHVNAVNNLEDILQVEGLDAIIVGPYDLSGSLGMPGEFQAPQFLEAMAKIRAVSRQLQVPGGVHIVEPDPQALEECIAQGNQFIAYGVDTRMLDTACRQGLQRLSSKRI